MGNRLFGVDIAGIIKRELAPGLLPVVLIKEVAGARGADTTAGQVMTRRRYNCQGFTESYRLDQIDGTSVQRGDKKILIIGNTLPAGIVPSVNDHVICEGVECVIPNVPERDPAAATYVCQARG